MPGPRRCTQAPRAVSTDLKLSLGRRSGPWQSPAAAGRCCAGRSEGRGSSRARNRIRLTSWSYTSRRSRSAARMIGGAVMSEITQEEALRQADALVVQALRDGSSLRGIGAVHQRLRQQWFKNGSLERGTSRTSCAARLPQRAHAQAQPDSASPRLPHGRGPNEGAAATAAEPDCTSDSATGSDSSAAAVIAPSSRSFCRCSSATGSKTQRHEQRSQLSRSMACHQSEHRHWNEELTSAGELTTPTPAC